MKPTFTFLVVRTQRTILHRKAFQNDEQKLLWESCSRVCSRSKYHPHVKLDWKLIDNNYAFSHHNLEILIFVGIQKDPINLSSIKVIIIILIIIYQFFRFPEIVSCKLWTKFNSSTGELTSTQYKNSRESTSHANLKPCVFLIKRIGPKTANARNQIRTMICRI